MDLSSVASVIKEIYTKAGKLQITDQGIDSGIRSAVAGMDVKQLKELSRIIFAGAGQTSISGFIRAFIAKGTEYRGRAERGQWIQQMSYKIRSKSTGSYFKSLADDPEAAQQEADAANKDCKNGLTDYAVEEIPAEKCPTCGKSVDKGGSLSDLQVGQVMDWENRGRGTDRATIKIRRTNEGYYLTQPKMAELGPMDLNRAAGILRAYM